MVAAEVPIVAVEAMLAALFMFTLVGPLSLPWWIPVLVVAAMVGAVAGLGGNRPPSLAPAGSGLAVLRDLRGRGRLVVLVVTAASSPRSRATG